MTLTCGGSPLIAYGPAVCICGDKGGHGKFGMGNGEEGTWNRDGAFACAFVVIQLGWVSIFRCVAHDTKVGGALHIPMGKRLWDQRSTAMQ